MDLESTLIKSEALFGKFRRLVEAVDKKQNFPGPRKGEDTTTSPSATPLAGSGASNSGPSAQSGNSGPSSKNNAKGKGAEESSTKVITLELRKLLSRNVEVLPRTTVAEKGDGMPDRQTAAST